MRRIILINLFIVLAVSIASIAQGNHEYSPLVEKTVNYKDWTLKNLTSDAPVNLRSAIASSNKKLFLVIYFAPWCANWVNEAPIVAKLYERYKADGLEIIAVSEYASRDDVKKFFGATGPAYTVVIESESRDDKQKTLHYGYRQLTGDTRAWGSPWNIFLEPTMLSKEGDVLTEKAWIVNGELIEAEADAFIRTRLGLPPVKP